MDEIGLRFRLAEQPQLGVLEYIEQRCFLDFQQSSRRSLIHSISSPSQQVWLVETGEPERPEVAGSIIIHLHARSVRIYSIATLPTFQGRGIGRAMLEFVRGIALERNAREVTLEARAVDGPLIGWYRKAGFVARQTLKNYYRDGEDAVKMSLAMPVDVNTSVVVVERRRDWGFSVPGVEVVTADEYIALPRYQGDRRCRVFNFCNSYRYQRYGYYISLLAAARNHVVIPTVATIKDFTFPSVIRTISMDMDDLIQRSLKREKGNKLVLRIFLGNSLSRKHKQLCRKLFNFFEAPLIEVHLVRMDRWLVQRVVPMALSKLTEEQRGGIEGFARSYLAARRSGRQRLRNYRYDLAILVDPNEKNPPSCAGALRRFRMAAEKLGFYVEFITREDFRRLGEFDALFIRETTSVNNHTYQFSRMAYAEGLVVIDDPWSILHCSNKIYLHERMKQKKIKTPATAVLSRAALRKGLPDTLRYPLILKQPDSAFSLGVVKVESENELREALATLFKESDLIIAQEFVQSAFDWRIGVLDGRPLFACRYYMAKGHWQIYNWREGAEETSGDSETLPLEEVPSKVLNVAVKAASLIGDGLYGIDLKAANGDVYLIEINDNPNVDEGVEDLVLQDNLYMKIMQSLLDRIELARDISRYVSHAPG